MAAAAKKKTAGEMELLKQTSARLVEGKLYGIREGQYQNDPQLVLPHDAFRHAVPDKVTVVRATGERTYVLENYTPESYNGDPTSLTGVMPSDYDEKPDRYAGRPMRPTDRMRPVPDFSESMRKKGGKAEAVVSDVPPPADDPSSADGLQL